MEEIVVTGIGLVTPQGCGREQSWEKIKAGAPIQEISITTPSPLVRFSPFVNPNGLPRIHPLSLSAVKEALADSALDLNSLSPERVGCSFSVSKPIFTSVIPEDLSVIPAQAGIHPPDSVLQFLCRELNIAGPSLNVIAACATGVHSIFLASRWLREKSCDVVIAGSAESSLHPLFISGFSQMGVLSESPCPFDMKRKGFMIGEGAGVLILERKCDALARGARIYSEISGCALGSDFNLPTAFDQEGLSISSVMLKALQNSDAGEVDYVNAHGTGTKANDIIETKAIKKVFGKSSYDISISSTKSCTGHLLGASGAVEAAIACLAIRDDFIPPTANLNEPDPECDLDYTPVRGKQKKISAALSLSMGFGGPIGAVVFRRC